MSLADWLIIDRVPEELAPAGRTLAKVFQQDPAHLARRSMIRLRKWWRGGWLDFPQVVHLETTNTCNLRCVMCPYPAMVERRIRPQGFMSEDLFRGLVRECAAAGTVEKMALMGLGEPFLHPRLIEMSRVAKRAGIRHVFTSTNGTTVNEETAARIVLESGFDEICFSVDGANSATYEGVRSRGAYEAVVRNVERMFRMRARWGRSRPHFVVQLLLMRETAGEVERFVSRWRPWLRLGDRMSIRDVDRFGGLVEDRRVRDPHAGRVRAPCKQLWRDAAVSWDGKVTVCCKDVYWRLSVADATKQSLREIWRSAAWNRLRDLHREGRYEALPICRNCSEWHT